MKQTSYTYIIRTQVQLFYEELLFLIDLAEHHYDGVCKSTAMPGGLLYGLRNKFVFDQGVNPHPGSKLDCELSNDQLDTLNKILEMARYVQHNPCPGLVFEMQQIFKASIAHQQDVYQGLVNTKKL